VVVNEAATKVDLTKAGTLDRTVPEGQSPGVLLRNRVLNPHDRESDQATIDDLFKRSLYYFPGALHLYDIRSKKRYVINTGIGDSEVLLIEGSAVYYRVDDSLFRAQIGSNDVQNAVVLLRDENVQVAHWAFLGP
jgi:hypothetical protein